MKNSKNTNRKLRILFFNAYFYPENFSFSHLEQDILEELVAAGHEVYVITPTPTRGVTKEIAKKYKKILKEEYKGVHVHRFRVPQEGRNPVFRAFRYFWSNLKEYFVAKKYRKKVDVMFSCSTPPTQGMVAGWIARKWKIPMVYSLQDVFPDSMLTTGYTHRGSLLFRIGSWVEIHTYYLSDTIVVLDESVKMNLLEKGIYEFKLNVINNWIDMNAVQPVAPEDNRLYEEYGIDRKQFVAVYAGNLGASQGTKIILKAAELLKDHPDIRIVIFGSGSDYHMLEERIKQHKLKNVMLNPLLPPERVPEVYSLGDVALITCRKGISRTAMPSKTWSIMACNTPIIASFDTESEFAAIIKEADAGVCVEPENPELLAQEIFRAYEDRKVGLIKYNHSRDYIKDHASREICAEKYVRVIEEAKRRPAPDSIPKSEKGKQ